MRCVVQEVRGMGSRSFDHNFEAGKEFRNHWKVTCLNTHFRKIILTTLPRIHCKKKKKILKYQDLFFLRLLAFY